MDISFQGFKTAIILTLFFIDGLGDGFETTGQDAAVPLSQVDVTVGIPDY